MKKRLGRFTGRVLAAMLIWGMFASACKKETRDESLTPGIHDLTLLVDGRTRTYRLYVPATYDDKTSLPLVIVLHGAGGTGPEMEQMTGFSTLADQEGFFAVYPDGFVDKHWADGRGTTQPELQGVDDVHFISSLIDEISRRVTVNSRRVYISGFSNGSMMGNRLALEISNKIAAVGLISGQLADRLSALNPIDAVGVAYFHGTEDPLVPYDGGVILGPTGGRVLSVDALMAFWVRANGANATPQTTLLPDIDPNDGCRVIHYAFLAGRKGTEVHLYRVEHGGHTWPGRNAVGKVCRDIDATRIIWDFFKTQSK